ncbi:agamous-like MADS-box protein AGL80 [Solanum tuberosum]|uniref:agamous-like MADS-box protein AGL80 n=1 Tax=Solanum tuberosum TaxID=4113 RepID=UPI00073A3308|nr:PREDICTED: agamous-like MADS-box protein AGL80 [Solanum tuberosum]
MVRKKVKWDFMENNTERRVSYRKRQKGFLTKARELNTLCDVELATLVNSPYHNEPEVFPNHEAATGMFTKFVDLPEEKKSKNIKTHEKITEKRIEKIEKELEKVRKENKKMEYTNQMYGLLNGEEMPNSRHPEDLNDLCYVINRNLKLINDGIKAKTHEEGSTSYAPQLIAGPMDSGGTNFDMSWAPFLALVDALVLSEIPLLVPSTVPSLLSSQRYPEMAYTMTYSMSSSMLPMAPQIDPSTNILSMSASAPIENNVNGSFGIPQSSSNV